MCACSSALRVMFTSIVLLLIIKCIGGQEMLENARCNHYPDRGTCEDRGFTTKWYYDRYAHRCREFYYGGCEGNDNRFDSFEECSQTCKYESPEDPRRRCALPHDPGTCAGDFERWHFDIRVRQCVCSWWSGCGGNANLFYSYDHCMSICGIFADNRTIQTRVAARRSIHNPRNPQLAKGRTLAEGRRYQNLFASSPSHLQYNTSHPGERVRSSYPRNGQRQGAQLNGRSRYPARNGPRRQSLVISNRLEHHPGQRHRPYWIVRRHGHMIQLSDGRWIPQAVWERIKAKQGLLRGRGQSAPQPSKHAGYHKPQQVSQTDQATSQDGQSRVDQETYAREIAAAQSRERLRAQQHSEAYARQQHEYERARAEALHERERQIHQQRREEYERAVRYQQELQRYQQMVEAAQYNRVPKERVGDTDTWQQQQQQQQQQQEQQQQQQQQQQQVSSQGQYWIPGYGQSTATAYGPPTTMDTRSYDEIRRAKLKLRKRLKFEKLKQMERMRRLLKTTPRPVTTAPTPPLQPQWWTPGPADGTQQQQPQEQTYQQQSQAWPEQATQQQQQPQNSPEHTVQQQPQVWPQQDTQTYPQGSLEQVQQPVPVEQYGQRSEPDLGYRREEPYVPQQPQYPEPVQDSQHYQAPADPYQALYDRAQAQPTAANIADGTTTTIEHEREVTQPGERPVTELFDIRRNHVNTGPEPDLSIADQSQDSDSGQHDRVQPDADRLPYGMVVAADRLLDRDGIRHAETVSAGPPPTEGIGRGKQIVAINDYDEDEHYTDDEGYRTSEDEDQRSALPESTPVVQWMLSTTLQPAYSYPSPSSTFLSTEDTELTSSMQQPETVTTTTTTTVAPLETTREEAPHATAPQPIPMTHSPYHDEAAEADEDRGGEDLEEAAEEGAEEEDEYDSEELFFWRPEGQGRRSGREADYYYADEVDTTTTEYAF